jgi:regulator of nucleoside diphosphate kinase
VSVLNSVEPLLTERDHARLSRLPHELPDSLRQLLEAAELRRSEVIPADIVTMWSRVLVHLDKDPAQEQMLTLCYPLDAEPGRGFISVLSPVGSALLGRRVGDLIEWRAPLGELRQLRIAALLFQPEASGDYLM